MLDSRSAEDFIKAVYVLQQNGDRVSTNSLAEALNVKAPSVTDMARRLEGNGLLDYQKYKGVKLSDSGHEIALKLLRRHRLIELYLVRELSYELHEVHDEAEVLEHNVSDQFIHAISEKLGNPLFDPHGDPIPDAAGVIARRDLKQLSEIELHQSATVARLKAEHADMLQHILDRGLCLNAIVTVLSRDPFEGPITIIVDGEERILGHNVAESVWVEVDA
jgi:DtxR family Mn-dependent transcriptional regulator